MKTKLLFLLSCLLLSCGSEKTKLPNHSPVNVRDTQEIKVDYSFRKVKTSELIDKVSVVKFTLPEPLILAEVTKVLYGGEKIIIMDRISSKVFCFSFDGNQIFHIDAQGSGPGEYRSLDDISINHSSNQIEILDLYGQQVLSYSIETGEYIKYSRFRFFTYGFGRIKAKRVFYNSHLPNGEIDTLNISSSTIFITDNRNKIEQEFHEIPKGLDRLPFVTRFALFKNESSSAGINFVPLFDNKIYNITAEGIHLSYEIDFGSHLLPRGSLGGFNGNVQEWLSFLNEKNYAFNLTNFLETQDFVSFEHVVNQRTINTIYDKKRGSVISYPKIKIEDDLGVGQLNLIGTIGQQFVVLAKQGNFNRKHRFLKKNEINKDDSRRQYLSKFTSDIDNEDDLLILITFKTLQ